VSRKRRPEAAPLNGEQLRYWAAHGVRKAFPERADRLLAVVRLWLGRETHGPACTVCSRHMPVRGERAAAGGAGIFRGVFGDREAADTVLICEPCCDMACERMLGDMSSRWLPSDLVLAEVLRAFADDGEPRSAEIRAGIEKAFAERPRVEESALCSGCGATGRTLTRGEGGICAACAQRAQDAIRSAPCPCAARRMFDDPATELDLECVSATPDDDSREGMLSWSETWQCGRCGSEYQDYAWRGGEVDDVRFLKRPW
jgi:hypothetical protein